MAESLCTPGINIDDKGIQINFRELGANIDEHIVIKAKLMKAVETITLCVEALKDETNQNPLENFVYGHLDTLLLEILK